MTLETIISLVTILVTLVCGVIAKKVSWFNNNLIPIQNIIIGILIAGIEWVVTDNFSLAISLSGLIAGGTYDIIHNLEKIIKNK